MAAPPTMRAVARPRAPTLAARPPRIPPARRATARARPAAPRAATGFGPKKAKPGKPADARPWVADRAACPCCSGRPYAACCEPHLAGAAPAPTAEALMRSRFTAYVRAGKDAAAYIAATTHPDNPAAAGSRRPDGSIASTFADDVRATMKTVAWQRLKVVGTSGGGARDDEGTVSFEATFKVTGQQGMRADGGAAVGTMAETSLFQRRGAGRGTRGAWLYLGPLSLVVNGEERVAPPDVGGAGAAGV